MQTPIVTRPLTDTEMQRVVGIIDAATSPSEALVEGTFAVFDALLSDAGLSVRGNFTSDAPLDGKNLKIPKAQWVEIGEALKARQTDPLSGTNILLDWMNVGPSAYEEAS